MRGVGTKPGWDSAAGGPPGTVVLVVVVVDAPGFAGVVVDVARGAVVLGSDGSVVVGASVVGGRVSVTGGSVGAGAGSAWRAPLATGATQTDSSAASAAAATATVGRRPCRLWVGMGRRSFEQRGRRSLAAFGDPGHPESRRPREHRHAGTGS